MFSRSRSRDLFDVWIDDTVEGQFVGIINSLLDKNEGLSRAGLEGGVSNSFHKLCLARFRAGEE